MSASTSADCVLRDSIATFYVQAMSVRFNKSTSKSTDPTGGSRALGPQGVGSSWPCAAQDLRALEGPRPGEECLISRNEIKARSPPQAAPSNSAARGGRQSQFSGYKPSL
jgi:hypothetical protein